MVHPCVLQDFVPFGAAAQEEEKEGRKGFSAFSVGRFSWGNFARRKKTRLDTRLPQLRAGGQGPYLRSLEHLGRSDDANKAGYTAISCGRVGRGGNTRFPTFQLERDGPTNQPTDRPTDGRTKPLIELRVRN